MGFMRSLCISKQAMDWVMLAMMFERCASKDLPWSLPECFDAMIPKGLVQGSGLGEVKGSK
jgi:hypothetical protein